MENSALFKNKIHRYILITLWVFLFQYYLKASKDRTGSEEFIFGVCMGLCILVIWFILAIFIDVSKKQKALTSFKNTFYILWLVISHPIHPLKAWREGIAIIAPIQLRLENNKLYATNTSKEFRYIEELHAVNEKGGKMGLMDYEQPRHRNPNNLHIGIPPYNGTIEISLWYYEIYPSDTLQLKLFVRIDNGKIYGSNFMAQSK